jgi:hypothetical protein
MSGAFAAAHLDGIVEDNLGLLPVIIAGGLMAIALAPILLLTYVEWKKEKRLT